MARTPAAQGSPGGRGADITAEEFGGRVHIGRVHTVRSLCAGGLVPGARKVTRASKIGQEWRIHWPTFYAALAGPDVPDGEIINSTELARRLRVPSRVVRRASAPPGTPDKLPGLQLGKTWLYALPAVQAQLGWPLHDSQDAAVPGSPAAGPAPAQAAPPARFQSALEYPAQATGQSPAARSPGRGAAVAAGRRRRPGPGTSPSPR